MTRSSARDREPDARQRGVDPRVRAPLSCSGVHVQVLAPRQMRMKARLLDDRADTSQRRGTLCRQLTAEQAHAARARLGQPQQQPDQRGLARAVRPQETKSTAARDLEVDALERHPGPEPLTQTGRLDGKRLVFDERCGVHEATVRAAAGARLGRQAERHPPKRTRCAPQLIRSNEPDHFGASTTERVPQPIKRGVSASAPLTTALDE